MNSVEIGICITVALMTTFIEVYPYIRSCIILRFFTLG